MAAGKYFLNIQSRFSQPRSLQSLPWPSKHKIQTVVNHCRNRGVYFLKVTRIRHNKQSLKQSRGQLTFISPGYARTCSNNSNPQLPLHTQIINSTMKNTTTHTGREEQSFWCYLSANPSCTRTPVAGHILISSGVDDLQLHYKWTGGLLLTQRKYLWCLTFMLLIRITYTN